MPAGSGIVVVDATPIIALSLLDHLDLLRSLYRRVIVPPAVFAEVQAGGRLAGASDIASASWIETLELEDPSRADLLADLDRGEAEAISLARELRAERLLMDERLGRQHARRLGLPVTGTLGVLLAAKEEGLIRLVGPLVQELRQGGIFVGERLVEETLRLAGESGHSRDSRD